MIGASRARLLGLKRELQAGQSGRDVLDQKRELLVRQLADATRGEAEAWTLAAAQLARAREAMKQARVAMGTARVEAAVLAQPESAVVERTLTSLVGVPVPRLSLRLEDFRPAYGPLGTAAELDLAGAAWHDALLALVSLADARSVSNALARGLQHTARRLGALETVVLPGLRREVREVAAALDEEERDEALRCRRFLKMRSPP